MVISGPCSIHDEKAALEYAERFARLTKELDDKLFPIMRVYFEKPMTTIGWKGLINDPDLNGSCDINKGMAIARSIVVNLVENGVGTGTEWLDMCTPEVTLAFGF